jgi:hypothetical protein
MWKITCGYIGLSGKEFRLLYTVSPIIHLWTTA